jgi:mRNA interferase RelE/StbE
MYLEKKYNIYLTDEAVAMFKSLDGSSKKILQKAIRKLAISPELGKPLVDELVGFRSWKISRFRIVYKIFHEKISIVLIGVGIRKEKDKKDIYRILKTLIKTGLLDNIEQYVKNTH